MKNRSGEKIKLASIDELLGVVNEESAMEIEISKMQSLMIEGKIQKEFLNSIPGFRENSYVQNAISRVEKYLEERHPNVENPLESNKKVDNEKNISEEKTRRS